MTMRTCGTRRISAAAVAALAVTLLALGPVATPAHAVPSSLCDRFGEPEQTGRVLDPVVDEASGIVASRVHRDVLWTHNDSGGEPELYALSPGGEMLGTYSVPGAENIDWEDIATGWGPGGRTSYLYIGDIGANFRDRDDVVVYRVAEPEVAPDGSGGALADVEVLRLRYPGGIVDAEALLVDPISGDLYILTKEFGFGSGDEYGISRVLRARSNSLRPNTVITMTEVAAFEVGPDYAIDFRRGKMLPSSPLPGGMVTAADVAPDGSIVLVRTYQEILAFPRPVGRPLEEAFSRKPCYAPHHPELQGEAVGFAANGDAYFTIGEGLFPALNRVSVSPPATRR